MKCQKLGTSLKTTDSQQIHNDFFHGKVQPLLSYELNDFHINALRSILQKIYAETVIRLDVACLTEVNSFALGVFHKQLPWVPDRSWELSHLCHFHKNFSF